MRGAQIGGGDVEQTIHDQAITPRFAQPCNGDIGCGGFFQNGIAVFHRDGDNVPRLVFTEAVSRGVHPFREIHFRADAVCVGHLRKRHQQPAIGAVVAGGDGAGQDLAPHEVAVAALGGEVDWQILRMGPVGSLGVGLQAYYAWASAKAPLIRMRCIVPPFGQSSLDCVAIPA